MNKKYLTSILLLSMTASLYAEKYIIGINKNLSESVLIADYVPNTVPDIPQPVNNKSCLDILNNNESTGNGIYEIYPDNSTEISIYCDMTTDGGGWTLISKFNNNNRVCNYFTSASCQQETLTSNSPSNSAILDNNLVKSFMVDSDYQELRAVGGGYDVIIRTTDKSYPLGLYSELNGKDLQCRNSNNSNWNNYNTVLMVNNGRGLTTWTAGNNYIGRSSSKICGNGSGYSTSDTTRYGYQWVNAGYTGYPTISGVFYIR